MCFINETENDKEYGTIFIHNATFYYYRALNSKWESKRTLAVSKHWNATSYFYERFWAKLHDVAKDYNAKNW